MGPTSTRDVLHDIQQAETEDYHNTTTTTTGMMTPSARIKEEIAHFDSDNSQDHMLIHSLNNSFHTDDEDEGDMEGGGQETTTPPVLHGMPKIRTRTIWIRASPHAAVLRVW